MQLTKLGHSCVRLRKDGGTLVIDPGVRSGSDTLTGANAVLVTHEHADHLDADALRFALAADADLQLWSHMSVTSQFPEFASQVHAVSDGQSFTAAGFDVRVSGEDHAMIMPRVPIIPNICFTVDGELYHPGDSFTVPQERVPTVLVPVSAPWLKFAETAEFIQATVPQRGYAIHDAILNEFGLALIGNLLTAVSADAPVTRLEPGTTVEL